MAIEKYYTMLCNRLGVQATLVLDKDGEPIREYESLISMDGNPIPSLQEIQDEYSILESEINDFNNFLSKKKNRKLIDKQLKKGKLKSDDIQHLLIDIMERLNKLESK